MLSQTYMARLVLSQVGDKLSAMSYTARAVSQQTSVCSRANNAGNDCMMYPVVRWYQWFESSFGP